MQVHEELSDAEIIAEVNQDEADVMEEEGEEDMEVERPLISHQEAESSVEKLQLWLLNSGEDTDTAFSSLRYLHQFIVKSKLRSLKQSTLDSYFSSNVNN